MLRVLYVSTELHPWVKTGGLADVNAALPAALIAAGIDTRLLLPAFPALRSAATDCGRVVALGAAFGQHSAALLPCRLQGVPAWLLECPEFFARGGNPYVDSRGDDWPDNLQRFALLGWAAARLSSGELGDWQADIVHSHDWHAALANAYLVARGTPRAASVFTVHNLAYQGDFAARDFATLGLPAAFYAADGLEFFGRVNFMKAGLFFADRITTVSPTYGREIQTSAHGHGLDGLLRARADAVRGILNGVDPLAWDPCCDPALPVPFGSDDIGGKQACKAALRAELGLGESASPLIGVVSRLVPQKGLDLLLDCVPQISAAGAQVVLLGSGDAAAERAWRATAQAYGGSVAVRIGYDEALAHRIYAAADLFVVPSRFEPCGLTQLYALRYGALPVVRRTGGLADTVCDITAATLSAGRATGFVFEEAQATALGAALRRAFELWQSSDTWREVQQRAMRQDFTWAKAAVEYTALYRELCASI